MLEAHSQTFQPSPFFRKIEPSPVEALAHSLTAALLSLGNKYDALHETVSDNLWAFLASIRTAVEGIDRPRPDEDAAQSFEDAIRITTIAIALLGFLDAASAQADFWRTGGRLALVQRVRNLLSDSFLTAVDGAFSTIRNAHTSDRHVREWKRHLKHYDHQRRPLGPVLLQRSFMWLLVSATSLLVADGKILGSSHVLDLLMANGSMPTPGSTSPDADFRSIELYASIAQEEMERLEAGADFLQMGSFSQQRLACAVKSGAIISFLNCSVLNEDAADTEILAEWLQECLEDSMLMLDETLAFTVLRSMAILSRISPSFAPNTVRLLPRFIVQAAPARNIIVMASRCLATMLHGLSHDAIISTLYTLGNVLSPSLDQAAPNGTSIDSGADGAGISHIYHGRRPSTGSSISLQLEDDQDTATAYSNIIMAICEISSVCSNEKITALAQAMLLQKLSKVNHTVDAQILTGAGTLSLNGGQLEFRTLLKLYSRECHTALVNDNTIILNAVSCEMLCES